MAIKSLRDALRMARDSKDPQRVRHFDGLIRSHMDIAINRYLNRDIDSAELIAAFEIVMEMPVGI